MVWVRGFNYIWSFIIGDWKFDFVFWIYECKYCYILRGRYISHHQSVLETICFWNRGLWKVTAHCWNSACRVRLQGVPRQAKHSFWFTWKYTVANKPSSNLSVSINIIANTVFFQLYLIFKANKKINKHISHTCLVLRLKNFFCILS